MLRAKKTVQVGFDTYEIRVLEGNHGGWLFVMENGQTIFENAGYKDDAKALSDGEGLARANSLRRYERASEQFLNGGPRTFSWGTEMAAPEANFAWLVKHGIALSGLSHRQVADEFEAAISTIARWASGTAKPIPTVRLHVVKWFVELLLKPQDGV